MSPCPEAAGAAADDVAKAVRRAGGSTAGASDRRGLPGAVRFLLLATILPVLAAALVFPPGARCAEITSPPVGLHIQPASQPLHVLCDEDQPPYAYKGKGALSGARGIYPELAAEAFRRMGLAAVMVPTPWARAMAELNHESTGERSGERSAKQPGEQPGKPSGEQSGERSDTQSGGHAGVRIGVCGLYATAQRRSVHDFSGPLFEERLHLVLPASVAIPEALDRDGDVAPAGAGGASLAALRGMRLGVVRGWSYGDTLDAGRKAGTFTTEEAGSEAQNLLKVAGGRLDGAIITREGTLWLRERLGLTRLVTMAPQPLAVLPVHLAFRRQDGQRHLLRAFDAAIRDMKADGSYARIVERALDGH